MRCSMKPTLFSLLLAASSVLSSPIWADDQPADDAARGVARISFLNGDVSVRRGDSGEIVAAAINAPLVLQDTLLTGSGATAEIQFDSANMIRLGQNSEVRLTELAYHRAQMQVANGTVTFRILRDSDSRMEIDTPQVSVRPGTQGSYRITIREDGTSEIAVRSGEAEIFTPRGSEPLRAGQMIVARGTAADPEFQVMAAPALDDWDRWNENRDRRFERTRSYEYVNRDINGAEDLDDSGDWVDSQYGRAWHPRVAADWAPYRNGHWAWVDYYGWTWVSDDSWGWAPYHYGNWFYENSLGWAWYPGAYDYPHYYWSPALVAFVGFGHGFGFGFGFGNVGWCPIAPFEPFHRWWGGGFYGGFGGFGGYNRTTINNTTIVNNINITNIYRNANVANGVTAVNAAQFGQNGRNFLRVSQADLRGANLVKGQVPVVPTRQSLQFANRQPNMANLPRTPANRQFSAHQQPQQVARVPFEQQRQAMQQVAKQTFSRPPVSAQAAGIYQNSNTLPGGRQANGAGRVQIAPFQQNANQRGGSAVLANNGIAQHTPAPQTGTGWRRFGETNHPQVIAPQTSTTRVNPNQPASSAQLGTATNSSGGQTSSGWRRAGEPARTQLAAPPSASGRTSDSGGWHRFGEPSNGTTQINRPNVPTTRQYVNPNRPTPTSQFGSATNNRGGQTSSGWSRFGEHVGSSGSQSRALPISPPIVRERPAPSYSGASGSYGGGRTYDSRPSQTYRPSPSNSGGGNYGGSRAYDSRPAPSYRPSPSNSGSSYGGSRTYDSRPAQNYRPSASNSGGSYGGGRSYESRPAPSYHPSQSYSGGGGYRPSPSSGGSGSYHGGGSNQAGSSYHSSAGSNTHSNGGGGSKPKDTHR
jgi:uncharacterized protein DUF6600/FecR-like protein